MPNLATGGSPTKTSDTRKGTIMERLFKFLGTLSCVIGFLWLLTQTKSMSSGVWWCVFLSVCGFAILFSEPWKGRNLGRFFNWLKWPHHSE